MSKTTCPSAADLERRVLGQMSEHEAAAVDEHLLQCAECLERLKKLCRNNDTLANDLRGETQGDPLTSSPALAKLVSRLKAMRPGQPANSPGQGAPTIGFACSACKKKLSARAELSGKKVKCPGCGQHVHVPARAALARDVEAPTLAPRPADEGAREQSPRADTGAATRSFLSTSNETKRPEAPGDDPDSSLIDFLAPPQAEDELGRLGKYRILKVLGHGGMGVVYQGEDPHLKRSVAIKAMLPGMAASASAGKRFLREAQAMAAVKHDHIVSIYEVNEERGVPFLAMEFLHGEPLDQRLTREPTLPVEEVIRIGKEIARALAAAHRTGLIHRDIKPANIWLETAEETGADRVKILDFGLARAVAQESGLTQQGAILGTPSYMAPEQAQGSPVDERSDLFSLGVVLYRLATGELPFKGNDTIATLMNVATHDPPPPNEINAEVPRDLSDLVMQLLEKDPLKRPESAAVVARRLAEIEPVGQAQRSAARADRSSAAGRTPGAARRSKRRVAAIALTAMVLIGGIVTAAIILVRTGEGDYVIETDDPSFVFQVNKAGGVTLEDRTHKRTYQLKVLRHGKGEFDLQVADDADQVFETKTFTIRRGQTVRLKAWLAQRQDRPSGSPDPDAQMPRTTTVAMVRKFEGHTDLVRAVALSRDAKLVLTGSRDKTAILWDAASGRKLQTFQGHTAGIESAALSGDARLVLTGGLDHTAILWDAASGKSLQKLQGHNNLVTAVGLSDDGRLALTASWDSKAILWDAASGNKLHTLQGHNGILIGATISADGSRAVTGGYDGAAIVWDTSTGKPLQFLRGGHSTGNINVALSGDGKLTATASGDKTAVLWATATGNKIRTFAGHTDGSWSVALSGDGKYLAYGAHDGTATLWETVSGKKVQVLKEHKGILYGVALSRDGRYLLTGAEDRTAILWKVTSSPAAKELPGDGATPAVDDWVKQVAAMPPPQQVVAVMDRLKELNPGFDGKEEHVIEDGKVTQLRFVTDEVKDISPLRALPRLRELTCKGSFWRVGKSGPGAGKGILADLGPLKGLNLTYLDCCQTMVSDLSPLEGMPLTELVCYGDPVTDLSPLRGMKLTTLDAGITKVKDLSPLKDMPQLQILSIGYELPRDAAILRSIKTLETLNRKPAKEALK